MNHGITTKLENLAHFLIQTKGGALVIVAASMANLIGAITVLKAHFNM